MQRQHLLPRASPLHRNWIRAVSLSKALNTVMQLSGIEYQGEKGYPSLDGEVQGIVTACAEWPVIESHIY
jgi:hypothetical protein